MIHGGLRPGEFEEIGPTRSFGYGSQHPVIFFGRGLRHHRPLGLVVSTPHINDGQGDSVNIFFGNLGIGDRRTIRVRELSDPAVHIGLYRSSLSSKIKDRQLRIFRIPFQTRESILSQAHG